MEELVTLLCPHCQERRTFQVVDSLMVAPLANCSATDEYLTYCKECGLGVLLSVVPNERTGSVADSRPHEPPITRSQTAGLPGGMATDLLEACRCYSFTAYRGAGLLVRRAVEQAAVIRKVPLTNRTFQQKLDWLLDEGHLPKQWKASADAVRDIANAAAHGASVIRREEAHTAIRAALAVVSVLMVNNEARVGKQICPEDPA